MKVFLKGSNRGHPKSKHIKPYKEGWYDCEVVDKGDYHSLVKLVNGDVVGVSNDRLKDE